MKVINLTPHDVDICDDNGNIIKTYKASGIVARIDHDWETVEYIDGVPLVVRQGCKTTGLFEPQEGVMYIVSNIVLDYEKDRMDLIAPVKQVKINGRVVGCRSFVSNR